MLKLAIIGGETHVGEVTRFVADRFELVGAAVREEQVERAREQFACPVVTDYRALLDRGDVDVVAVANENDRHAEAVEAALDKRCDAIVDKPLAITLDEQAALEARLAAAPTRRLLMLLTLRGNPPYMALRAAVGGGRIGTPAHVHVRMAVQLKRAQRPEWFLDCRRSGGLFLDLLIHGLDQVEWLTGRRIVSIAADTGNLQAPGEAHLRDHATAYCRLEGGGSAVVEGQRMMPSSKGSDYRVLVAGTGGYAELDMAAGRVTVTDDAGADQALDLPERLWVVRDWLDDGGAVPQPASLRANRLALAATEAAETGQIVSTEA